MESIQDLIRSADGGGDAAEIARVVIRKILASGDPDEQERLLLPVVRREVHRMRRQHVRRWEDRAFSRPSGDELAALRELRDQPFADVITKRMITWGEATRQQHLARARWLRHDHIRPVQQTAARHEAAARLLADRHAERLADLPEFAQAA